MSTKDENGAVDVRFISQRIRMVDDQLVRRGIKDAAVLNAMRTVPRHLFIPEQYRHEAYYDGPLPIGEGQTISQPFVVASMTEHLELEPGDKVLEIGTGCGYQAAVLAEITDKVWSIEMQSGLLNRAREILKELGYDRVKTKLGDGSLGWSEEAPFDAIIVTAAAPRIPDALLEQLKEGGRMVLPLITGMFNRQDLVKIRKTREGMEREVLYEVRFVPMRGKVEE
ncbi:MAG: protein-L-isoaspartate(D-aspartate) O-methyltransferase [Candidatus Zixiibacteriota bacterium]